MEPICKKSGCRIRRPGDTFRSYIARFLLPLILLVVPNSLPAHEDGPSAQGFHERLGKTISTETRFLDEHGNPWSFSPSPDMPTILVFIYYNCTDECGLILTNLASVLDGMDAVPAKDYRVVTVSIDERETPAQAMEKRRLVSQIFSRPLPDDAWRFLTGNEAAIHTLADSVGFGYERSGDVFIHPLGLVVLSSPGKIVRYIRGDDFLPADVGLSLMEASKGIVGPTISKFVRFCFSVDPESRTFTFNVLRAGGTATLVFAGLVVLIIARHGRKRRAGGVK